ncbi:hypothetical protein G7Y89_g4075 [Cudoniella acicularis]|uniref:GroES-like protein n=1 Tax=Cudoniella acicularis TaxID=354080 RepID=A0A8H4RQ61_9HELO|nr:hypothetical protein G7Y89_g4075 [Cudoniella acicularis]
MSSSKLLSVSAEELDIPTVKSPLDAVIRLTSSAICVIKVRDRVIVNPLGFKVANDGESVLAGFIGVSDSLNFPGVPASNGGQVEYMVVPFADENLLKIPPGKVLELDYLLLSDIFPTAWFALESAGQVLGDNVVVFGAGAIRVYSVDNVPARLAKAESIGAIPINFDFGPADAQILKLEPNGVDRSCDCIGSKCVDEYGNNIENLILTQAVNVTRVGGGIGVIGVYLTHDLGRATPALKQGILPFPIGQFFLKNLSLCGGAATIHAYQELLKTSIDSGKARPSFVFEKEFRIEDAEEAYREFNDYKITKAVFRFPNP